MRRRVLRWVLAAPGLLAAAAVLAASAPVGGAARPVDTAQLMAVLPRGDELPGYRAEFGYPVGDEVVGYRVLAPPKWDSSSGGAGVPLEPGLLEEPGRTVTFVRTGGVVTYYRSAVPQTVAEAFDERLRRARSL
jgi:hypothetical protein